MTALSHDVIEQLRATRLSLGISALREVLYMVCVRRQSWGSTLGSARPSRTLLQEQGMPRQGRRTATLMPGRSSRPKEPRRTSKAAQRPWHRCVQNVLCAIDTSQAACHLSTSWHVPSQHQVKLTWHALAEVEQALSDRQLSALLRMMKACLQAEAAVEPEAPVKPSEEDLWYRKMAEPMYFQVRGNCLAWD